MLAYYTLILVPWLGNSKGCKAKREFADVIGLTVLYQQK